MTTATQFRQYNKVIATQDHERDGFTITAGTRGKVAYMYGDEPRVNWQLDGVVRGFRTLIKYESDTQLVERLG